MAALPGGFPSMSPASALDRLTEVVRAVQGILHGKATGSDELWSIVEPLLPKPGPKKKDGRPRIPDRACLTGIVFVLKTGIQWEDLPQEMGCGCGMTCWRRLRDWQAAGVWEELHRTLLTRLGEADRIDWSRASI